MTASRKVLLVLLLAGLVAILFFYDQGAAEHYAGKAYAKVSSASQKVARWTTRMFDSSAPSCEPGMSPAQDGSAGVEGTPMPPAPVDGGSSAGVKPPPVDIAAVAAAPADPAPAIDAPAHSVPANPPESWSSIPEQGKAPPMAAAPPSMPAPMPAPGLEPKVEAVTPPPSQPLPAPPPLAAPAPAESRPPIADWSYPVRPTRPTPLLPLPETARPTIMEPRGIPESGLEPARAAAAEKRVDDAIREYRRYLSIHPNDTNAFGELGNVYLSAGRNAEAAQNYYEAATRLIDAGRIDAVAPLMPIIRRHEPMLYALLERKAARAVQGDGMRPRR